MTQSEDFIPAGYMYKLAGDPPDDIAKCNIDSVYSAGDCGGSNSPYFADYINFWKHNAFWWFDSPQIIEDIAAEKKIDLTPLTLFYYEFYPYQFNYVSSDSQETQWTDVNPYYPFTIDVIVSANKKLEGYDVVEYCLENSAGCSLLSCSGLAEKFPVNRHCLFDTLDDAKAAMETKVFLEKEPGPYRIIAVYTLS